MNPLRTIIVDDHQPFRRSVRRLLQRFEFAEVVGEAASAEEALEAVEKQHPDLVIADIRLPGMDGFEFSQVMKDRFPRTKVVLITMYGNPAYRNKAEWLDLPYVHKQWILEELPNVMEELNSKRGG